MKKYLIPILMIAVLLSAMLAACGSEEKEDDAKTESAPKAAEINSVSENEEGELPRIAVDGGETSDASEGKNSGGSANKDSGSSQSSDSDSSSKGSSGGDSGKGSGSGDKSGNSSGDKSDNKSGDKTDKNAKDSSDKDNGKSTSPTTGDKGKDEPTIPSEISKYIEENGEDELPFVPA